MAEFDTLSNPTVEVNNDVVGIVPNSTTYKTGNGEKKLRPQSAGGNSIVTIQTENAETKKSMVKFSLYNTKGNIDLVKAWQVAVGGNSIGLSQASFTQSFNKMYVINDPEVKLGADGTIDVEFEGQPAV